MLVSIVLVLGHQCIDNNVVNVAERECYFGSYSQFEYLAGIAADMLSCPTDCDDPCGEFDALLFSCSTLGVLVNYREACTGYYAIKAIAQNDPHYNPFSSDIPNRSCQKYTKHAAYWELLKWTFQCQHVKILIITFLIQGFQRAMDRPHRPQKQLPLQCFTCSSP